MRGHVVQLVLGHFWCGNRFWREREIIDRRGREREREREREGGEGGGVTIMEILLTITLILKVHDPLTSKMR